MLEIYLKFRKTNTVGERSWNLCSQGNLTVAAQQNNLLVLHSYRNSFCHTWCSRRILIIKCAFVRHIACNFIRKSREIFSVWGVVTLYTNVLKIPRATSKSWNGLRSSSAETKPSCMKTELKRRILTDSLWNKYYILCKSPVVIQRQVSIPGWWVIMQKFCYFFLRCDMSCGGNEATQAEQEHTCCVWCLHVSSAEDTAQCCCIPQKLSFTYLLT